MITKTDLRSYLEAPLHLWAAKRGRLEALAPSPFEQHLMEQGNHIETVAKEFIAAEAAKRYTNYDLFWQLMYTDGAFQARSDAVIFDRDAGVYDIYEVKSATSVKKEHEYDLAFQALVCAASLPIRDFYLVHVNKEYTRQGEFDPRELFVIHAINAEIAGRRIEVEQLRSEALRISQLETPDGIEGCVNPDKCVCPSLCHPELPEYPIYDLNRIGVKALALKQQGILAIQDIPVDYPLSDSQWRQVQVVKQGKPWIDQKSIQSELDKLVYPLYFLDYETFNPAVPLFDGYRPYDHIVFQYSLYVIGRPGGQFKHHECLLIGPHDPGKELVENLAHEIGPRGSVIVWYKLFEAGRNKELARRYTEYSDFLLDLNARMYDLMEIFSHGYYLHPDFRGRASLKKVLPVVVPEMRYEELEISSAEELMMAWWNLFGGQFAAGERDKLREDMLRYCEFDTLAMVKIWEKLEKLTHEGI